MWFLDFPEHDPDSNYRGPSARQVIYADQARSELRRVKSTLEKLTVPQQRAIIREFPRGVFKRVRPAGDEPLRRTHRHPHQRV